eukprot:scaffold316515_cov35-Prasinocladus_malaysianus.AAC.1
MTLTCVSKLCELLELLVAETRTEQYEYSYRIQDRSWGAPYSQVTGCAKQPARCQHQGCSLCIR